MAQNELRNLCQCPYTEAGSQLAEGLQSLQFMMCRHTKAEQGFLVGYGEDCVGGRKADLV